MPRAHRAAFPPRAALLRKLQVATPSHTHTHAPHARAARCACRVCLRRWLRCTDNEYCRRRSDRLSLSLINRRVPFLYASDASGVVLAAEAAAPALLCAWAADGLTFGQFCPAGDARCIPGCHGGNTDDAATAHFYHRSAALRWCDTTATSDRRWAAGVWEWDVHHCAFHPHQLQEMLSEQGRWRSNPPSWHCDQQKHDKCRYNEVVLSRDALEAAMPAAVEAFVYPASDPSQRRAVEQLRERFVQEHGLGGLYGEAPVLAVDWGAEAPFQLPDEVRTIAW